MKHWMKKLIVSGAVLLSLGVASLAPSSMAFAEDKAAPAAAAPAAAAPAAAPAAEPAAAAPVPNKGDTAWLLVSTALVIMMTVPA